MTLRTVHCKDLHCGVLQWKGKRDPAGVEKCESMGQEEGENVTFNTCFIKNNFVPPRSEEAIKVIL